MLVNRVIINVFKMLVIGIGFSSINACGIDQLTGQNKMVSDTRNFQNFSKVIVSDNFNVEIIEAESYSVKIRARRDNQDNIKVRQNGEVLSIKVSGNILVGGEMKVTIATPNLNGLHLRGNSQTEVKGEWLTPLDMDVSDNAEVIVQGVFSDVSVNVSENGVVNLEQLESETCSGSVSGNGEVKTKRGESC